MAPLSTKTVLGLAACVILTGCDGFFPSPSPAPPRVAIDRNAVAATDRPEPGKSWLAADIAKTSRLLFVSDAALRAVDIFALPTLTPKGRLTGFKFPSAECSDNHGNVWVVDYVKHELFEYSHAGKPLETIAQAGLEPYGCAVNPATGAVAVVDLEQPHQLPGRVLIYARPSAAPIVLSNPEQHFYFGATYDSSGNLWVTGSAAAEYPMLSKCSGTSCQTVTLHGGSIFEPGNIAWDNAKRRLIVFDDYCHDIGLSCSYPVSTSGAVGPTTMYLSATGSPLCAMPGAAVATTGAGAIVVGSDNELSCTGFKNSTVDVWTYPTGGVPVHARSGVIYPWGVAISTQ